MSSADVRRIDLSVAQRRGNRGDAAGCLARVAEHMHTEPRGQGSLPWRLRLNDLLGRAYNCACASVANCTTAAPPRRLHGAGKPGQPVRERRNHKLTSGRRDEERWPCLARSA